MYNLHVDNSNTQGRKLMFHFAGEMNFDENAKSRINRRVNLLLDYLNHLLSSQGLPKRDSSQNKESKTQKNQKQDSYFPIPMNFVIN